MKKDRSVWDIFYTTYKTFIVNKPKQYFLMVLLSLLPALVSPVKVYLESSIFDYVDQMAEAIGIERDIYRIFLCLAGVQILYVAVYPIFRAHVNYFGSEFENILQNCINNKTTRIPLKSYEYSDFYKDIDLASSASRELRFMTMMFSSEILLYFFQFIAVSGILCTFHPLLVLLSFLAVLPDIFAKIVKADREYLLENEIESTLLRKRYYESVLTTPKNIKEIRVYQNKNFFYELWNREREEFNRKNWELKKKNSLADLLNQIFNILTIAAIYGITIWLTLRGAISVGAFAASLGAVNTLKFNFGRICNLAVFSFQCGLKGKYYYKVLDYEERVGIEKNDVTIREGMHCENVGFSYVPNKEVLKEISFVIHPGEKVAVVGENGSGKSTLVKIMLGLFQPDTGAVYYGYDRINDIKEECIYRENSAVFQDFCKYALTLWENVAISDMGKKTDRKKIQELLKAVSFHFGEIALDTGLVREFGGMELSGGNWQKLAIARGLYRSHHFIAFDEPTSAIDPLAEEQVIRSMLESDNNSIKVFVTHRLNTTKLADKIIVLEHGRIVGHGTHDQLMNNNPVYTKLWNSQANWYSE